MGIAQRTPYDVILHILRYSARLDLEQSWGGAHFSWKSNEAVHPYLFVSRSWYRAASAVLYSSVILLDGEAAKNFLSSIEGRPDLAQRVMSMTFGICEDREDLESAYDSEQDHQDSLVAVQPMDQCSRLKHLHVRPLHPAASVRDSLFSAISTKPLLALCCSPRLIQGPLIPLFEQTEIRYLLPTLRHLEIDAWTCNVDAPLSIPIPKIPVASIRLVSLQLHFELHSELLTQLLEATGPTLQFLVFYTERILPAETFSNALRPSVSTLKALRWISNPPLLEDADRIPIALSHTVPSHPFTAPLFDRILPQFQRLESITVTAIDISSSVLRLIPPFVQKLSIHTYDSTGLLDGDGVEAVIETLEDERVRLGLKTLEIRDQKRLWGEETLDIMEDACERRGIPFSFWDVSGMIWSRCDI